MKRRPCACGLRTWRSSSANGRRRAMTDLPHVGLYRRATAAALVIASALFLIDNIIHPTEYERDNEARQLTEIAAHSDRWQLAHALGFLSIMVFTAAVLGLA